MKPIPRGQASSTTPITNEDAMNLLADLLSGPRAEPKPKASPKAKPKAPCIENDIVKNWNLAKTGYVSWKAIARVVVLERQICKCCDAETLAVQDEFFLLENGVSKARWMRKEGYDIQGDDLPLETTHAEEPRYVSACGQCSKIDLELAFLSRKQMELPL